MAADPQNEAILKRIKEREEEQLLLLSLIQRFAPVTNNNEFNEVINTYLKPHIAFDSFIICLGNEAENKYYLQYHSSKDSYQKFKKDIHEINDGFFDACLNCAEPIAITNDVNSKKGNSTPYFLKDLFEQGIREVISYPLHNHNNNALVVFAGFKKPATLTRSAQRLLRSLSIQMAITIDNILLREKPQYKLTVNEADNVNDYEEKASPLDSIIGKSIAVQNVKEKIMLVADSDSGVLLLGESGTGKELVACAIHENSAYKNNEMVKVNCAAIPKNLIESELFGHEKGSFTGAVQQKTGKFERANNSTLFLDEVGELPMDLQVKLLRVLQEKEIERIGGNTTIPVNVRIIAATNRDLQHEVALGNFRSDLYYRLNIFPISIPPLRDRVEDLNELSSFFLKKYSRKKTKKIAAKTLDTMKLYSWPGNIRELEHAIERAVLLTTGDTIKEIGISPILADKTAESDNSFTIKPLAEFEKKYIIWVLSKCNGRISGPSGAAALLDLPPTTLQSKMQKLGIKKKHFLSE